MITHDVDEAVLLSDRIVMMTNGPAATIGEILPVKLARPRDRLALAEDREFVHLRQQVLEFLYAKQVPGARTSAAERTASANAASPVYRQLSAAQPNCASADEAGAADIEAA